MQTDERVKSLRRVYYDYLNDATKLSDLEKFIYGSEWLQELLGEDDYLELVSINFRGRKVRIQLADILIKHVGWAEHQREILVSDLKAILNRSDRTPEILSDLYDKYCDGYYFLNDLGLGYGLCCSSPNIDGKSYDSWDDLSPEQQARILRSFQPGLESDVRRAIGWIESEKIVLVSKRDELNRMEFEDSRTEDEKKSTVWKDTHRGEKGTTSVSQSNIKIENRQWWKKLFERR